MERTTRRQTRHHNIWSTMPPETHSIDDNPLFELLKRKARQLKGAGEGVLRIIFLADAGSTLLNRIGSGGEQDPTRRRVSGREIIFNFLQRQNGRVDAVVVFAPRRERELSAMREELRWRVTFFGKQALPEAPAALDQVAAALPRPRFEGYQARSLFRQGAFAPSSRGWHLAMVIEGGVNQDMRVKFPARMLLELLAGRMTPEQFRHRLGGKAGDRNVFQHWLDSGMTISRAEIDSRLGTLRDQGVPGGAVAGLTRRCGGRADPEVRCRYRPKSRKMMDHQSVTMLYKRELLVSLQTSRPAGSRGGEGPCRSRN